MTKRKVLIPIDGSTFSQHILLEIPNWFQPEKDEIVLLNVAKEPEGGTGVYEALIGDDMGNTLIDGRYSTQVVTYAKHPIYKTQIEAGIVANATADLQLAKTQLSEDGFVVNIEVAFGDPAEQIVAYANRHEIDLIAMTTHGRTGLRRLVMGSVAEHVLTTVNIPVFLLRPF